MRKSNLCLMLLGVNALFLILIFAHAHFRRHQDLAWLAHVSGEVARLELTDLCLFTEARYTRHLSQADLFAPFQDHPLSLEHFPVGSIAGPPAVLERSRGRLE